MGRKGSNKCREKDFIFATKKNRQDTLFPVGTEEQISPEENIASTMFLDSLPHHISGDHYMSAKHTVSIAADKGLPTLPSTSSQDEPYDEEAFDVLYCIAFAVMDAQWLVVRHSCMEFNPYVQFTFGDSMSEGALRDFMPFHVE